MLRGDGRPSHVLKYAPHTHTHPQAITTAFQYGVARLGGAQHE